MANGVTSTEYIPSALLMFRRSCGDYLKFRWCFRRKTPKSEGENSRVQKSEVERAIFKSSAKLRGALHSVLLYIHCYNRICVYVFLDDCFQECWEIVRHQKNVNLVVCGTCANLRSKTLHY
jgi:hypothetical protein